MLHPRALLDFHGREHAQRFVRVGDDLERRGGIARKHAPASLQFLAHGSFQRIAPGVEIVAGRDHIAVERTGARAIEQRQRIGPAVEIDRHLAQANEIGAAGQTAAAPPAGRATTRAPPWHRAARRCPAAARCNRSDRDRRIRRSGCRSASGGSAATARPVADVAASETMAINGSTSSKPANARTTHPANADPGTASRGRHRSNAPRPASSHGRTRRGIRPRGKLAARSRRSRLCRQYRHCQSICSGRLRQIDDLAGLSGVEPEFDRRGAPCARA